MAFQYDPNQQQPQFQQENNGNGAVLQQQQGPPAPQGMAPPQQQGGQDGGSPAPFAQQGGNPDGSGGSVSGDAKTTLWYVMSSIFLITINSPMLQSHLFYPRHLCRFAHVRDRATRSCSLLTLQPRTSTARSFGRARKKRYTSCCPSFLTLLHIFQGSTGSQYRCWAKLLADYPTGWVSLSHGSTRTLSARSGSVWASKSTSR